MALPNRMSLRPGLLWLTLNLATIIQCSSWNTCNIFIFFLFYVPPKMSSRTPGGTLTPGWIPLFYIVLHSAALTIPSHCCLAISVAVFPHVFTELFIMGGGSHTAYQHIYHHILRNGSVAYIFAVNRPLSARPFENVYQEYHPDNSLSGSGPTVFILAILVFLY
jgi:hypothetical protein